MEPHHSTFLERYGLNARHTQDPCLIVQMCLLSRLPLGFFHKYNVNMEVSRCLGWTAGHVLAILGHPEAYRLIPAGLDIHKKDKSFHLTPFQLTEEIHGQNIFVRSGTPFQNKKLFTPPAHLERANQNVMGRCAALLRESYTDKDRTFWNETNVNQIADKALGMTATHIVAIRDKTEAVLDFIQKNADFYKKDYLGWTPLDYMKALHGSDKQVRQILMIRKTLSSPSTPLTTNKKQIN